MSECLLRCEADTLRAKLAEAERQRDEAVKLLRECIPALGYKGPFAARIEAYLAGVSQPGG